MYWHCRLFSICVQLGLHIRFSRSDPGGSKFSNALSIRIASALVPAC